MDRLAQGVSDHLLADRRPRRSADILRRVLVERAGDPDVTATVAGTSLRLPLSHQLPHYRRKHPAYSENLGVIAGLVSRAGGRTMIDIGANVGDSVAIVKAHAPDMAILCVEGDPLYVPYLRDNVAPWDDDVELAAPVLLGDHTGDVQGALRRVGGTTHLASDASGSVGLVTLDDLLVEHPAFADPALLKSDTDGFEHSILRGAAGVLERAHPVLVLEYDPSMLTREGGDGLELLRWLRSLGYAHIAFYDNFGARLVRTTLDQEALLGDLHDYLATSSAVYYYDIVVAGDADREVVEAL